jgi:Rod binding domain-containing protein
MNAVQPSLGQQVAGNRQGVTPAGGSQAPETAEHRKLRKAAEDFETILISELWQQFQSGMSSLSGGSQPAGSDTLNSLATQSLSSALAHRGGLGIAQMIVRQLEPTLNHGGEDAKTTKIKTASSG